MRRTQIAVAVALLFVGGAAMAGPGEAVFRDGPILLAQLEPGPDDELPVVVEDRSQRERLEARNAPLPVEVELSTPIGEFFLPAGTDVGRFRQETRVAPLVEPDTPAQVIRQRTELREVLLTEPIVVTNPLTGLEIVLDPGTLVQRLRTEERFDAEGNVLRDRVELRAVLPDGQELRIRARAPEIDAVEMELEDGIVQQSGSSGGARASSRASSSSSGGSSLRTEIRERVGDSRFELRERERDDGSRFERVERIREDGLRVEQVERVRDDGARVERTERIRDGDFRVDVVERVRDDGARVERVERVRDGDIRIERVERIREDTRIERPERDRSGSNSGRG